MLRIVAALPDQKFYKRIQDRGERWQWQDVASDRLLVLAPANYDPWVDEQTILVRLENSKTRAGVSFPRRLNLLVLPEDFESAIKAEIIRERWFGGFAYSTQPTDLFFAFSSSGEGNYWLMLSIISDKMIDNLSNTV